MPEDTYAYRHIQYCCDTFAKHAIAEDDYTKIEQNTDDGTWSLDGCCGGGCYVAQGMRWCPWCGHQLLSFIDTSPPPLVKQSSQEPLSLQELTAKIEAVQIGWWYATCCSQGLCHITTQTELEEFFAMLYDAEKWYLHTRHHESLILNVWSTQEEAFEDLNKHGYPAHS